jgi:hypothetical protein
MQTMTQGRDGISLAPNRAPGLIGVARRRLSVVAAMLAMAAFVAGTASSGYAGSGNGLTDPVTVSNYGAIFAGSLETFAAGSGHHAKPEFRVKGTNSQLSEGPYGDAVSSVDGHIAVALPFDFLGVTGKTLGDSVGCGPFGVPATGPLFGTGFVALYSPGASGNSAPEVIICAPGFSIGEDGSGAVPAFPNTPGVFLPQGVAFESPFDGVSTAGHEILAVANALPEVVQDATACGEVGLNTSGLGTITEYDRSTFTPGLNNAAPFVNNPVAAINPFPAGGIPPVSTCPSPPFPPNSGVCYTANSSIGGCASSLAGPRSLAFDGNGFLFVVNNAPPLNATLAALPHFVTVYPPGAPSTTNPPFSQGDVFPTAIIGLDSPVNATSGTLINPIGIAVATVGFESPDELIFVSDTGDNSIKIFEPFTNSDEALGFAFTGTLIGTIQGGTTKLKHPEGIALSSDGDTLYVVNQLTNTLSMFSDIESIPTDPTGVAPPVDNIAPTLSISGDQAKMNFPTGAAIFPQFTSTSE